MKSVYAKILLWCFGSLALSLLAFVGVTMFVSFQSAGAGGPWWRIHALQMEEVREAYESGGAARLAVYLDRWHKYLSGQYYLTDSSGKDLVSGADRSPYLTLVAGKWGEPIRSNGHTIVAAPSDDGKYRLIQVNDPPFDLRRNIPYYLLILGVIALLCWLLAVNIASPLRALAGMVDRFGAGDLAVRVNSERKDEIGELGRAFDRMAERIGTLLTAERRLLQDISHELRSPLARLSFAAELARTAENREAAVARLKKEIQRLTDLVGALIEVTRAEGELNSSRPESIRLDSLLAEVVEDCQVEAEARGCRIALSAIPKIAIRGDRELLRRAVENVVRNSIRYTPSGSAVDVELQAASNAARISVRDYGPGVPEPALFKIFQPFFRVDDSRDSATGGVGLGLAIARRAISVHHGRLWAQNVQPGLTVWIELPMAG
jgi:signal transduction histidine kinase